MANILFGTGIADARGSVGGITFSRGAGGAIMRTRIKPSNPATSGQQARRGTLSLLASNWSQSLNASDRAKWETYASGTPWTNKLNQSISLTGMQAYLYINGARIAVGLAINDTPPLIAGVAVIPVCTITAVATTELITIAAAPTGFVAADPLNAIAIHAYNMTAGGATSTFRRRKLLSLVPGNAAPPAFPMSIASGQNLKTACVIPVEVVLFDINGRVSSPYRQSVVITTP